MLEELETLFQSSTIRPSFEKVHIILALFIFDENPEGIGRYRLKKELLIGEGTAKSLINKLNAVKYISVLDQTRRKGHILTSTGLEYLKKIMNVIPFMEKGDSTILKDIIIDTENTSTYFCLVKKGIKKIRDGVSQRDAAIKINGSGATCIVYDGKNLVFPTKSDSESRNTDTVVNDTLNDYFKAVFLKKNIKLEDTDVIVIGSGISPQLARLATLNAALTLI
ncbi:MAG: DUF4443 domain-containing protein [Promethearchaeota archaeon]